jgi:hypothetical protein
MPIGNWTTEEIGKIYAEIKQGRELVPDVVHNTLASLLLDERAAKTALLAKVEGLETRALNAEAEAKSLMGVMRRDAADVVRGVEAASSKAISATNRMFQRWVLPVSLCITGPVLLDLAYLRLPGAGGVALLGWGSFCLIAGLLSLDGKIRPS